jgi:hypothetical protein
VQEGGLHRVKLIALGEAFYRYDVLASHGRRQRQTRQDNAAFDDDRACAACTLVAPLLGANQASTSRNASQERHGVGSSSSSWYRVR